MSLVDCFVFFAAMACTDNKVYNESVPLSTACEPSCSNMGIVPSSCVNVDRTEGCACSKGMVYDSKYLNYGKTYTPNRNFPWFS